MMKYKASGILFCVHTLSEQILKDYLENIDELKNINAVERGIVFNNILIFSLFQAQRFCWDNIIANQELGSLFEKELNEQFNAAFNADVYPSVREIIRAIKQDPTNEVSYLGMKVCRDLQRESLTLALEINTLYSSILVNGFFDSLKIAWETPTEQLKELYQDISLNKL